MANASDALAQFKQLQESGTLDALAELRKENRELDKIITDAALLVAYTEVSGMLDFVIAKILDHFIPSFLAFLIQPPRGGQLRQYCYRNLHKTDEEIPHFYYDLLKERFHKSPGAVSFQDLSKELGEDLFVDDFKKLHIQIVFPMVGIGGVYGIVILGQKVIESPYTELEQKYLDRIIRFLSVSLQNGLHYESSITDPKTGLFTHDYFIRRMDEELAFARRHGSRSGILMIDVDHFKRFNDSWGHVTGDRALVALAEMLTGITRNEDCVARFGGEEFSVLLSECNSSRLVEIAERIREATEVISIPFENKSLSFTISIGARMVEAVPGNNSLILLSEADKALYRSKTNGRNRVTLFSKGLLDRAVSFRSRT